MVATRCPLRFGGGTLDETKPLDYSAPEKLVAVLKATTGRER
jgi:hypothetical protein